MSEQLHEQLTRDEILEQLSGTDEALAVASLKRVHATMQNAMQIMGAELDTFDDALINHTPTVQQKMELLARLIDLQERIEKVRTILHGMRGEMRAVIGGNPIATKAYANVQREWLQEQLELLTGGQDYAI